MKIDAILITIMYNLRPARTTWENTALDDKMTVVPSSEGLFKLDGTTEVRIDKLLFFQPFL